MVISTVNQVVYNGDGVTVAWPYTFRIIDATDIQLTIIDADGTETPVSSDYYVDTVNNTVYYPGYAPGAEPPEEEQPEKVQSGQKLLVYRQLPITQEKDLGDKWPFNVIELGLDKLTMILQQIAGWWDRCLKISAADEAQHPGFDLTFPIVPGKSFRINSTATGFEPADDPAEYAGAAEQAAETAEAALAAAVEAKDAAEAAAALVDVQAFWFDNVADMRAANLPVGATAGTKGYYSVNDGGGGTYAVREADGDTDDGGAIIILDNGNVAELIVGNTVYPQQFGAYCDRVHDDSGALQNAINYVANKGNGIGVTINKDMIIDGNITVPMNVDISADINSNRYPLLYIGNNCTKVFDCVSKQNSFNAIRMKTLGSNYRSDLIGWDFHGDESYNVDSSLLNSGASLMSKGVVVRGRNLRIYDSFFGHCKYGVYYDFPVGATQIRGCEIKRTRFHGIGEETDLKFVDCSAIYMKNNSANLTIQNCIADQGGTFLEGYANVLLMEGNFVESFAGALLKCEIPSGTTVAEWNITGNVFKGKSGTTTYGESAGLPENLIYIKNKNRVSLTNNTLSYAKYEGVVLDSVTDSLFSGNNIRVLGNSDAARKIAFSMTNCSANSISNNMSTDASETTVLAKSADSSSAYIGANNVRFSGISGIAQLQTDTFYPFANITAGTETNFTYDDIANGRYIIKSSDLGGTWVMTKEGSYVNIAPFSSLSRVDYINISKNALTDKLTFSVKRYTISNGAWSDVTGALAISKMS